MLPRILIERDEPPIDDQTWDRMFPEVCSTVNRTMIVLFGYMFFCFLTLGQQDRAMFDSGAIDIPFANIGVSWWVFLLVGPIGLLVLTAYLHIYLGRWEVLRRGHEPRQTMCPPYMFNLPLQSAVWISVVIFYVLPCVLLCWFAWKALPIPSAGLSFWIAVVGIGALVLLAARRFFLPDRRYLAYTILAVFALVFSLAVAYQSGALSGFGLSIANGRPVYLAGAELPGRDFVGYRMASSHMERTILHEADFREASLAGTKLAGAELNEADMQYANLECADLQSANLTGAELSGANLRGATLIDSVLNGAFLHGATLVGAVLEGVKLDGETVLTRADLRGTSGLTCETLTVATDWRMAYRDEELQCEAAIPSGPIEALEIVARPEGCESFIRIE